MMVQKKRASSPGQPILSNDNEIHGEDIKWP